MSEVTTEVGPRRWEAPARLSCASSDGSKTDPHGDRGRRCWNWAQFSDGKSGRFSMDFTRKYMKLMQIVLRMILKIFIWDDFVDV